MKASITFWIYTIPFGTCILHQRKVYKAFRRWLRENHIGYDSVIKFNY